MREKLRFLGLDVHAETITIAVAEPDGSVRSLGTIANRVHIGDSKNGFPITASGVPPESQFR